MPMPTKMKEIEEREGKPITDVICELYEKHGQQTKVAKQLNIAQSTLNIWLLKLGLSEKTIIIKTPFNKENTNGTPN